jgi:hypothetical protein
VNVAGFGRARAQSRLRAAVNARLEEISFRTGLITATIGLVALSAIAAAGVYAATLSLGGQAVATVGALSAVGTTSTTPTAPKATPTATASARPTAPAHPRASSAPKATQPVTVATTNPQPATGAQAWAQAGGSQPGPRYYGRAGFGDHGSWYPGQGSWSGGYGSRYGAWPGHTGPGFPASGFGPGPRGFGRP